jgi:hypothetical protein
MARVALRPSQPFGEPGEVGFDRPSRDPERSRDLVFRSAVEEEANHRTLTPG